METHRVILHIDMDAFYASIEQRDNPDLRDQPVAVGGSSRRGVIAAASYEARKYGIHSAMPSAVAFRKCPDLIFIRANFEKYRQISRAIRDIFLSHTAFVEPLSLDEAYLDVSKQVVSLDEGSTLAQEIRREIKEATSLNASAGISFNKFLAKMASDVNKPNGQYTITQEEADNFLLALPVKKFHGIGQATASRMQNLGIQTGEDLRRWGEEQLVTYFGKAGHHYYNIVRGNDRRDVKPNRLRKSIGVERTFGENIYRREHVEREMQRIISLLLKRIKRHGRSGKTLTLKLRYSDFNTITRSKTIENIYTENSIRYYGNELLKESRNPNKSIRLLGLTVSNLEEGKNFRQLELEL